MKRIYDKKKIAGWIEEQKIAECFDTKDLEFYGSHYEKGEYLVAPSKPMEEIMFVIRGVIQIYGVRDNGSISPVNQVESPTLLGDIEFSQGETPAFFVQAKSDVTCVCLSLKKYRESLNTDLRFLHVLLRSYGDKLRLFALDVEAATVEQRVLQYLRSNSPGYELNSIEAAVLQLRCSRRQLQRVLKNLADKGQIQKIGKGRYRLTE